MHKIQELNIEICVEIEVEIHRP